jgi:hypothetical protein
MLIRHKAKVGSGCSTPFGFTQGGGRQKAKVGSGCSTPFGFMEVGIFCLLPFTFCLSGCCFSPQSKIENPKSKIVCRPFGDPDWVTDTA